jgi:glycosyltransferase involved in cell wall biosynthesis
MKEKKKILYMITKGGFGGAQKYVYDLATEVSKDDFEVVVACGLSSTPVLADKEGLAERLKDKGIRVIDLIFSQRNISFQKEIKTFLEIYRIVKQEKPDILHLNSSKIGGLGALAGRICGVSKIIFTGHGWAFNEERSFFSKMLILFFHWLTITLCHTVIAVSEKTKNDISWMPFVTDKIKVVYNGINVHDKEIEKLSESDARIILASQESEKTIIFSISELHKNKGIDVALKGISLLPTETKEKIIYSIASDGEERENLEKLAKELGIENLVRFLGFVPNAKKLLVGADIFLFPSRTEAFPYAILEAGAAGLPIIATNVGGVPEIIHDMQNGILIHPRNSKEIAEAILYLFDHPEKQKEFGREIKKTVSNFFSPKRMLEETINLYQ